MYPFKIKKFTAENDLMKEILRCLGCFGGFYGDALLGYFSGAYLLK